MARSGESPSGSADGFIGSKAGTDANRLSGVLRDHVARPRNLGTDAMTMCPTEHSSLAEDHRCFGHVLQSESDHLGEEATRWDDLFARILKAGKNHEARRSAL